jgi:hypothetical protein
MRKASVEGGCRRGSQWPRDFSPVLFVSRSAGFGPVQNSPDSEISLSCLSLRQHQIHSMIKFYTLDCRGRPIQLFTDQNYGLTRPATRLLWKTSPRHIMSPRRRLKLYSLQDPDSPTPMGTQHAIPICLRSGTHRRHTGHGHASCVRELCAVLPLGVKAV